GETTMVERGTVTSQADNAFSSFSGVEKTETVYDAYARPQYMRLWNGGSIGALSQISYDSLGRRLCSAVRMNSPILSSPPADACTPGTAGSFGQDRIERTNYDAAGRVSSEQSGYGTSDVVTTASYTYTPNGHVQTLTDARSYRTTYGYDGFDRFVTVSYPSP